MVQATFIKSAVWPRNYPEDNGLLEIAVAGRSNVGKSSLINTLTNRKQLARVSNTPGRTQLLNFFLIDDAFILCDLPGFGYAKVPMAMKKQWGVMMERYLTEREPLRALLLLIDIRRSPGEWEREIIRLGSICGWGVIPVVTKLDKLSRNQRKPAIKKIAKELGLSTDQLIGTSSTLREGFDQLWLSIRKFTEVRLPEPPSSDPLPEEQIDEESDSVSLPPEINDRSN